MDDKQPSTRQKIDPGSAKARPKRTLKLGQRAAQAALAFLMCAGGFPSLFTFGPAITRASILLPAINHVSVPATLVVAVTPSSLSRHATSSRIGTNFSSTHA